MLCCARYAKDPKTDMQDGEIYTLNYGEFQFGRISWSERLGVGEQRIRTLLKKLIKEDMIHLVSKHRHFSIYKIKNYEKFNQQINQQDNQQVSLTGQRIEPLSNQQTNQQDNHLLTTCQPPANHLLTTKEESNNTEKKDKKEIKDIFEYWNSLGIIKHRELTQKIKSKINARLEKMSPEEISEAMRNYQTVLNGDLYWWSHKFTLEKFMEPKNIDQFLTDNNPFENFRKQKGGGSGGKFGSTHGGVTEASRKAANRGAENFIGTPGRDSGGFSVEELQKIASNFE